MAAPPPVKRPKPRGIDITDVMAIAREMQGKDPAKELSINTEDRDFREIFGVGPEVALLAWNSLEIHDVKPEDGTLRHFMWSLLFLKGCATEARNKINCGGADKKTMRKWMWLFVSALADLEPHIVSFTLLFGLVNMLLEHKSTANTHCIPLLSSDCLGKPIQGRLKCGLSSERGWYGFQNCRTRSKFF